MFPNNAPGAHSKSALAYVPGNNSMEGLEEQLRKLDQSKKQDLPTPQSPQKTGAQPTSTAKTDDGEDKTQPPAKKPRVAPERPKETKTEKAARIAAARAKKKSHKEALEKIEAMTKEIEDLKRQVAEKAPSKEQLSNNKGQGTENSPSEKQHSNNGTPPLEDPSVRDEEGEESNKEDKQDDSDFVEESNEVEYPTRNFFPPLGMDQPHPPKVAKPKDPEEKSLRDQLEALKQAFTKLAEKTSNNVYPPPPGNPQQHQTNIYGAPDPGPYYPNIYGTPDPRAYQPSYPAHRTPAVNSYPPSTPWTCEYKTPQHVLTNMAANFTHGGAQEVSIREDLRAAIINDQYVDLFDLLYQDAESYTISMGNGPNPNMNFVRKARRYLNTTEWNKAFGIYMSAYLAHFPERTQHMLGYMRQIQDYMAAGINWQFFDHEFRKDRAASRKFWNTAIERLDLWQKASNTNFPLYDDQRRGQKFRRERGSREGPRSNIGKGYCEDYNKKYQKCRRTNCIFKHKCPTCDGAHPLFLHDRLGRNSTNSPRGGEAETSGHKATTAKQD